MLIVASLVGCGYDYDEEQAKKEHEKELAKVEREKELDEAKKGTQSSESGVTVNVEVNVNTGDSGQDCYGICPGSSKTYVLNLLGQPYSVDNDRWSYRDDACASNRLPCSVSFRNDKVVAQRKINSKFLDLMEW
jgi:hypothetical protein